MKGKLFLGAVLAGGALLAFAAKDPVLMKINGNEVRVSEFEYLFNKNNRQQIEKESIDDYFNRFENYKLKVADGEALGVDTTQKFRDEYNMYLKDLVSPYLIDTVMIDNYAKEAYDRFGKLVDVSHIMVAKGKTQKEHAKQMQLIDSIRNCAVNGQDFADLARRFSIDRSAQQNGGHLGWVRMGAYPYPFENACYTTPVGQVSDVVETDFGYHIVLPKDAQTENGQISASHILIFVPENADQATKDKAKVRIDSISIALKNGADFAELAKKCSDDKRSGEQGGKLGYFGRGRMVPEFEKVAFDLKVGETSEPFTTKFGYHIVKVDDFMPIGEYSKYSAKLKTKVTEDVRGEQARKSRIDQIKKQFKYQRSATLEQYIDAQLSAAGGLDSAFVERMKSSKFGCCTYGKKKVVTMGDVAAHLKPDTKLDKEDAKLNVLKEVDKTEDKALVDEYINYLKDKDSNFRNLLNEYRDGMILFDVSDKKIWTGASSNREGIEAYFDANRSKYTWNAPKFKGTFLLAKNDSVMQAAMKRYHELGADTAVQALRKEFKRDIKIEKVLAQKGDNSMADYVAFNGEKKAPADKRYVDFQLLEGKVLDGPECADDVMSDVLSDYQADCENIWIKELHSKYKVEVNEKEKAKLLKKYRQQ